MREEFWNNVNIIGTGEELNQSLEKAGRVADFLELGGTDVRAMRCSERNPAAGTSA